MTGSALLITVRLPDGRFHGLPEWPPSPFRLFQALIAGALTGTPKDRAEELGPTWSWFESLPPPLIAAPPARIGRRSTLWAPNNDIDAVGGDPRNVERIRTSKRVAPRLLADDGAFLYLWSLPDHADGDLATMVALAEQLYQFGRGIDMAYATAEACQPIQLMLVPTRTTARSTAPASRERVELRADAPPSVPSLRSCAGTVRSGCGCEAAT